MLAWSRKRPRRIRILNRNEIYKGEQIMSRSDTIKKADALVAKEAREFLQHKVDGIMFIENCIS